MSKLDISVEELVGIADRAQAVFLEKSPHLTLDGKAMTNRSFVAFCYLDSILDMLSRKGVEVPTVERIELDSEPAAQY